MTSLLTSSRLLIFNMKILDDNKIAELLEASCRSPRRRVHHLFHDGEDAPIHKLYIAMQPDSYIQPHRHVGANRWEMLTIIKGAGYFYTFNDKGEILSKHLLSTDGPNYSIEVNAGVWHVFVSIRENTVIQEVKSGPYMKPEPGDFAAWAPAEGEPGVFQFLEELRKMEI